MSLELIVAIALWCGMPGEKHFGGNDPKNIQKCREKIYACVPLKNGIKYYEPKDDAKCFTDEKL